MFASVLRAYRTVVVGNIRNIVGTDLNVSLWKICICLNCKNTSNFVPFSFVHNNFCFVHDNFCKSAPI
jgi:hypothetical protein